MQFDRARHVVYSGPLWQGDAVHPDLWALLLRTDHLIEITTGGPPYAVVLGVPHHAAPGVQRIAQDWLNPQTRRFGRIADENSGLFALAAFSALCEKNISCRLVIAAHPSDHDPNKTPHSPYWKQIFIEPLPKLLLELHGAAQNRRYDLELSAGKNDLTNPLNYGRVLAFYLQHQATLAVQKAPGSGAGWAFEAQGLADVRLENPALETLSLREAARLGVQALHLEMRPVFRQPDPAFTDAPRPAPAGGQLARGLAEMLRLTLAPDEIEIRDGHSTVSLTRPSVEYETSFLNAAAEADWRDQMENPDLIAASHADFVELVKNYRSLVLDGLPEHPPEEYLWLVDRGEWVGRILLLHWLNEYRLKYDGQIDYWIRPSKRRQGYGRQILRLGLERCRQIGLKQVLLSCRSENVFSRKIIEANNGVFESEIEMPDALGGMRPRRRYWISL